MSGAGGEPPTIAPASSDDVLGPKCTISVGRCFASVKSSCHTDTILTRSEKRKLAKKQKRQKQRVAEAENRKQEEEIPPQDPEAAAQELKERQESKESALKEHEEQEARWYEREREYEEEAKRRTEQQLRDKLLHARQADSAAEQGAGEEAEDEDGPSEIIWRGNEIIVRKKKKKAGAPLPQPHSPAPHSNPFPPAHPVLREALLSGGAGLVTEKDRAVCPFFSKTGACAYGGVCSRAHVYPTRSPTLLLPNMYRMPTPLNLPGDPSEEALEYDDTEAAEQLWEFYFDVHTEFQKFGEVRNFKICGNAASHLRGNVYVNFWKEEAAEAALEAMAGRFYASRPIVCHFSPVQQWKRAICGEFVRSRRRSGYDGATCHRGTGCNFLHPLQNPDGDYEWADVDERPPASWAQAMDALYGKKRDRRSRSRSLLEDHSHSRRLSRGRRGSRRRSREGRWASRSPRDSRDRHITLRRGGEGEEEGRHGDARGRSTSDRLQGRGVGKHEHSSGKGQKDIVLGREKNVEKDREGERRTRMRRREESPPISRHRIRDAQGQRTRKRVKKLEGDDIRGEKDSHRKSLEGRVPSIDALDRWQE